VVRLKAEVFLSETRRRESACESLNMNKMMDGLRLVKDPGSIVFGIPRGRLTHRAVCQVRVPSSDGGDILGQKTKDNSPLKVSMVSLGCPKNTVDGEVLLGDLFRSGFGITDDHANSDAIVVNTCGFVEDAKSESIENIIEAARLKEEGKVKKVIVTGCLAQRYNDELAAQLPEIDLVMGFEKYGSLPSTMKTILDSPPDIDMNDYQNRSRVQVGESTVGFRPEWDRFRLTPPHTAYLRVAEGCNHACSFCAIPGFRYDFLQGFLLKVLHIFCTTIRRF